MCEPATASLAIAALSGAVSAYGQYQQGKAQASQYNYQAAVDRNNKIIADRQADDAINRGKIAEQEHRDKVNQIKGRQRVQFAANGIDLGSDVVGETLGDTAMFGELDALTIRSNAENEAYGYRVQGMNYEASAALSSTAAKNASNAGRMGAFTTILGTAGTVGGKYTDFKNAGAFNSSNKITWNQGGSTYI